MHDSKIATDNQLGSRPKGGAKDRQIVAGIAAAKAKYPVIQGRGVSRVHELSWPVEGLLVAVRGTTPSGSIRPPQQGQRSAAS